jgi:hypothetical protein
VVSRPAKRGKNDNCIKNERRQVGVRDPHRHTWTIWGQVRLEYLPAGRFARDQTVHHDLRNTNGAIAGSVQAAMPLAFPLIVEAPRRSRDAEWVTIRALKSDATSSTMPRILSKRRKDSPPIAGSPRCRAIDPTSDRAAETGSGIAVRLQSQGLGDSSSCGVMCPGHNLLGRPLGGRVARGTNSRDLHSRCRGGMVVVSEQGYEEQSAGAGKLSTTSSRRLASGL